MSCSNRYCHCHPASCRSTTVLHSSGGTPPRRTSAVRRRSAASVSLTQDPTLLATVTFRLSDNKTRRPRRSAANQATGTRIPGQGKAVSLFDTLAPARRIQSPVARYPQLSDSRSRHRCLPPPRFRVQGLSTSRGRMPHLATYPRSSKTRRESMPDEWHAPEENPPTIEIPPRLATAEPLPNYRRTTAGPL